MSGLRLARTPGIQLLDLDTEQHAISAVTTEEAAKTISILRKTMGPKGLIRVVHLWQHTNGGNNKIIRLRWNGIAGTMFCEATVTTLNSSRFEHMIANNNSVSAQKGSSRLTGGGGWGGVAVGLATAAVNTDDNDVDIVLSGQKASAGDLLALEYCTVELLRP